MSNIIRVEDSTESEFFEVERFTWENGSGSIPPESIYYENHRDQAVLPSGQNVQRLKRPGSSHEWYWSINGSVAESADSTFDPPEVSWEVKTRRFRPLKKFTYCNLDTFAEWLISDYKAKVPGSKYTRVADQAAMLGYLDKHMEVYAQPLRLKAYEAWARDKAGVEESDGVICHNCLRDHKDFFVKYQLGSRWTLLCHCKDRSSA
jgi:hypothetical protein